MGLFSLWGWCLSGTGKMRIQIPIYIYNAVVNCLAGLLFIKLSGLIGPIIGTLSGFIFVYAWMLPRALKQEMEVSSRLLYFNLMGPLFIFFPFGIIAFKYQDFFKFKNFIQIGFAYGLFSLIIASILYVIYLDKSEKTFVKKHTIKKLGFSH